MDNLTHSLFGLTLARTPLSRAGRGSTVALLLASNAPDIDILTTAGGAVGYLHWHRGPTHGPLGIVGLGLVTAAIASFGERWRATSSASPRAPFMTLWFISTIGVLCHVLMDLPTSYGTRLLSPFSWTWFAEDWLPIIDIYLLAALGAGLWLGRTARRRGAILALALMAVNYGVRGAAHHQAIARAQSVFGAQLPAPCGGRLPASSWIERWPRPPAVVRDDSSGRCLVEVAALPTFISPFQWRLVARLSNSYEIRDVNLLDDRLRTSDIRLLSVRYPNQWTPAVSSAAQSRVGEVFLGFARFAAVRTAALDDDSGFTVRWDDLRFLRGPLGNQRAANSFTATILVSPQGDVLRERLGP